MSDLERDMTTDDDADDPVVAAINWISNAVALIKKLADDAEDTQ